MNEKAGDRLSYERASIKDKFRLVASGPKKYLAMGGVSVALLTANLMSVVDRYTTDSPRLRNLLPEPFDLFDHSGNFTLSMYVGAAATYLAAHCMKENDNEALSHGRRGVVLGLGVAAATFINGISELKLGVSVDFLTGPNHVADPIDFGYGVAAGAFAAYAALEVHAAIQKDSIALQT